MKVFLDASALAKRYIEEQGSDRVEAVLAGTDALGLSVLCLPEVISALCRRRHEESITGAQYNLAKQSLMVDIRDADIINLTAAVLGRAIDILENHHLRAMDALHIASALEWEAELFVSADSRQIESAPSAGLDAQQV